MFTLNLIYVILAIVTSAIWLGRRKKKLPPGPRGIPLLGNFLEFVNQPHLKLSRWAEEFGDLYTIKLANRTALVLSSTKVMKEIFGTKAGVGKFRTDTFLLLSNGPYGILNTEGKAWNELRQFCFRNLKKFGFGNKVSWEPLTLSQVDRLIKWVRDKNKKDTEGRGISAREIRCAMQTSANSPLWAITFSGSGDCNDPENRMSILIDRLVESIQRTMKTGLSFFPSLKYIFPKWSGYLDFKQACMEVHNFFTEEFHRHKETYRDGEIRDLMDYYVEHLNNVTDPSSSFYGEVGVKNAIASMVEVVLASYETTGSTLTWLLIYLAAHPEVQEKLREEVKSVIGFDRDPSLEDRPKMPYAECVIAETFRFSTIGPLGVPHELLEDLPYNGYILPKGAILIPNLYHIHRDKVTWIENENHFIPERFLEDERLKDYVVPFQLGKRACPGEYLSRDTIFLNMTKLVQKFEICMDGKTSKEEYLKADEGLLFLPREHNLIIRDIDT